MNQSELDAVRIHYQSEDGGSLVDSDLTAAVEAHVAAVDKSEAVNVYLTALRDNDVAQFENVRKLPFDKQATLAGV